MRVIWSALAALIARVAKLDRMARRGRVVPEIGMPAIRELFHEPYRVIYRIDATSVVILTLRHWSRSWDPGDLDDGT